MYIKECKEDIVKNTLAIRKRIRDLRMNYKKEDETSRSHNKGMFCNVGEN